MSIDSNSPLTSRARFKFKALVNIAKLFLIFTPVIFFLSWLAYVVAPGMTSMLIVDVAAIAALYYLYTIWDSQPIPLLCDECGKLILSNTPWVCGFCQRVNANPGKYPFVDKCGHCENEPKAYRCHHCQELIFLTQDKLEPNYAYCFNSPAEIPEPDARTVELVKKKHERE